MTEFPGRGAWTKRGFPVNPGATTGFTNMYRRHTISPVTGGQKTLGLDYEAVHYGVRAIQDLLDTFVDGLFGPKTEAAAKAFQETVKTTVDGIVGPTTMRLLLNPTMAATTTQYRIPDRLLYGIVQQESMKDPGAVGATTPDDRGLVQINLGAHKTITMEQACTPSFAIDWAGARMRAQHDRFMDRDGASKGNDRLSWDCAVAYHNSPAWASSWATTGTPPTTKISTYVARVREYGQAWT